MEPERIVAITSLKALLALRINERKRLQMVIACSVTPDEIANAQTALADVLRKLRRESELLEALERGTQDPA